MRLSFLAFATAISVAEGAALRGLIDEMEESPSEEKNGGADVDSRPFLHTRPRKADLPLFSRVLATLDYKDNEDEYDLCEGDCDKDDDCDDGLKCFQR